MEEEILKKKFGIKNPNTGEELTMNDAIACRIYNFEKRQFCDKNGDYLPPFDPSVQQICSSIDQQKMIENGLLKLPAVELDEALSRGF